MEAIDRMVSPKDWISVLFLLSLILLIFAKSWYYPRFLNFVILPFNNRYVVLYNKKGRLLSGFHLSFTLFQLVNLSLFAYLAISGLLQEPIIENAFLFPVILGGILAYTCFKVGVQWAGGYIFRRHKLFQSTVFTKLSYLNYGSLVLFVANLLLAYFAPGSIGIIAVAGAVFLIITTIGLIDLLKMHQNTITSHMFYFILYLCALEIGPLLIVSNLLKS